MFLESSLFDLLEMVDRCNVKWATSESSETTGEIKGPAGGVVVSKLTNTRFVR